MQVKVDFSEYKPWSGAVCYYKDLVERVGLECAGYQDGRGRGGR